MFDSALEISHLPRLLLFFLSSPPRHSTQTHPVSPLRPKLSCLTIASPPPPPPKTIPGIRQLKLHLTHLSTCVPCPTEIRSKDISFSFSTSAAYPRSPALPSIHLESDQNREPSPNQPASLHDSLFRGKTEAEAEQESISAPAAKNPIHSHDLSYQYRESGWMSQ
jgi:hypothetical protein